MICLCGNRRKQTSMFGCASRVHELPVFQVSRNSNALRIHICHRRTHTDRLLNFAKTVFIRRNKCLFLVTQNLVIYLRAPVWSALGPPALETTQTPTIIFNIIFTKTMHFILQRVCIICLVDEIERKVKTKKGD